MSVRYVGDVTIDLGERIHIRNIIKPKCGEDLPFLISSAKYELIRRDGTLEASGACTITGHELDIMVRPEQAGKYCLRYTYEIADETWVDNIEVTVR